MPPVSPARRALCGALALALTAATVTSAAPAHAQTAEELAAARHTFNEGKDLEKKREWSEALERFKKVAAVKMTPQVRFHIALCEENLGKLVSAIHGFELAGEEARAAGSSAAEVAQNAPTRAAALRKRIGSLQITVSGQMFTSTIALDDAQLPASALANPIPVDPGAHTIDLRDGAGKSTFRKTITIAEGASEKVALEVDDIDPAAAKPRVPVETPPPPPPSRAPIYAAGALGAASLVASGVFFGLRANTISDVSASCKDKVKLTGCDPTLSGTADTGRTYGTLSGVFLGVGIAGVVTAGILAIALRPKKPPPAVPKAALIVAPGTAGVLLRGAF